MSRSAGFSRPRPASITAAGWAALVLLLGGAWPAAKAEQVVVDRIVAVVEDDAIFQSDVDQAVKQMMLQRDAQGLGTTDRAALENQVIDELVKNKLVIAKANRLGISVAFSDVEKAVDRAIEDNKKVLGGEQAFSRQLEAEGLSLESLRKLYREQIRNRMLVERVLSREIDRSSVKVPEEDIRKAYEERKATLPERPAVVHLATIFIGLDSSAPAREKAKAQIDSLYQRILAGEDFTEIAKRYSEDPSAENGGNLGKLKLSDLGNRAFAEAAAKLTPGKVSPPVLTPFGYHLIEVTAADSTTGEVEIRHILVRLKAEDKDIQDVFAHAEDVHRRLVEGAPFDSTAMRYSTDDATAPAGGDLGWLRESDLPEFFRDVLGDMKIGEFSPVLREPSGFRIVKLLEREGARSYSYEEVRDELKQVLEQDKVEAMYDTYLEELKTEFYVDLRPQ